MKIKFIYPPLEYVSIRNEIEPSPPLGIAQLTSALRLKGYAVEAEDLCIGLRVRRGRYKDLDLPMTLSRRDQKGVFDYIHNGRVSSERIKYFLKVLDNVCAFSSFDVIGLSVLDRAQFTWALFMARYCIDKKIPVIFGGSYMNTIGYMYMEQYEVISYLMEGGADVSLISFLRFLEGEIPVNEVPDLRYRAGDKIEKNARAPFDIENAPLPDFSPFDLDLYRAPIAGRPHELILRYQMSCGCFNHCAFCNDHSVSRFQHKSVQKVLKEVGDLSRRYDSHTFIFSETSLYFSYDFLDQLCTGMIEQGFNIRWGGMTAIVDREGKRLDEPLIRKMSDCGCHFLHISPETGDEKLRYSLSKMVSNDDFEFVLEACRQVDFFMIVNFVYGFPYEDESTLGKTIDFIDRNKHAIDAAVIVPFYIAHNSPYSRSPEYYKIRVDPVAKTVFHRPFYVFREEDRFDWDERRRYFRKYERLDEFVFEVIMKKTLSVPKYVPFFVYWFILRMRYRNNLFGRLIGFLMRLLGRKRSELYAHPYLFKFNKKYLSRRR